MGHLVRTAIAPHPVIIQRNIHLHDRPGPVKQLMHNGHIFTHDTVFGEPDPVEQLASEQLVPTETPDPDIFIQHPDSLFPVVNRYFSVRRLGFGFPRPRHVIRADRNIRPVIDQRFIQPLAIIPVDPIVAVDESQIFTAGETDPDVARLAYAIAIADFGRGIGRTVIDQDDLDRRKTLPQQRIQALGQIFLHVVYGNHEADPGHILCSFHPMQNSQK